MSAVARLQAAWNSNFFVVDGLLEADSNARRAGILLRLSDAVVAAKAEQLGDACREVGFPDGASYIAVRLAIQSATRTPTGELPPELVNQVELWRRGLAAIAGAHP